MTPDNPTVQNRTLRTNGPIFTQAINNLSPQPSPTEYQRAVDQTTMVLSDITRCYDTVYQAHELSEEPTPDPVGLIYGRIQSGKTRAMILSSAMAFDNGFNIVVVITTDINRLVDQTRRDFEQGLPGTVRVYSKSHFADEVDQARRILQGVNPYIVLVCSKGARTLRQLTQFLDLIGCSDKPAIIFDDEGDQATLDTNAWDRSTTDPNIPPSAIHGLIHDPDIQSLRRSLSFHVFVSVTGTPQGIVLQNLNNPSRARFITLLEPGADYVGGMEFFPDDDALGANLVHTIPSNERINLLAGVVPVGLSSAIKYFLLAAAGAAIRSGTLQWPEDGGYKMLCHPSVRTRDHHQVARLIRNYVDTIADRPAADDFADAYHSLQSTASHRGVALPPLDNLLQIVGSFINTRQVLEINNNTTADQLEYSRYFNFLIGGNTLGRGLAIRNLLVTYYVREAKIPQMDTMYQHARMFGYRRSTLPYTKVFLPPQLYANFREICLSDDALRQYITNNQSNIDTIPIQIVSGLRPTRQNILDGTNLSVLTPGRQFYPNRPIYKRPEAERILRRVTAKLAEVFPNYQVNGLTGLTVPLPTALEVLSLIKTRATNRWNDNRVPGLLTNMSRGANNQVVLKYRTSERTADNGSDGELAQGVLFGGQVAADAAIGVPVLWVVKILVQGVVGWDGVDFVYPTIIVPAAAKPTIFNRS